MSSSPLPPLAESESTVASATVVETSCCGGVFACWQRRRANSTSPQPRRLSTAVVYHDAASESEYHSVRSSQFAYYFFDAEQEPMEDDDYDYPPITTDYIPTPLRVSLLEPETMLRQCQHPSAENGLSHNGRVESKEENGAIHPSGITTNHTMVKKRRYSKRFELHRSMLTQPKKSIVQRGYPGTLTESELDQVLKLHAEIQILGADSPQHAMVYIFHDIEDTPYSLCRFLRSTRFRADKCLERMNSRVAEWNEAASRDFYPDLEEAMGIPPAVFLHLYPFVYQGNAKNGCPVSYFQAGRVDTDGVLSVATLEEARRFFWHSYAHMLPVYLRKAKELDPHFCRSEVVQITDLKGLSRSQLSVEAMEVIKIVSQIAEHFPETLHSMLLLNAPSWFSMIWRVISNFISPRQARMIEVYSNPKRGQERLLELVNRNDIPEDFGGTAPCVEECIQKQSRGKGDSAHKRMEVKVIRSGEHHHHGTSNRIELCRLESGESGQVQMYTRSQAGTQVSVWIGDRLVAENVEVKAPHSNGSHTSKPSRPHCKEVIESVDGPGTLYVSTKPTKIGRGQKGTFVAAVAVR